MTNACVAYSLSYSNLIQDEQSMITHPVIASAILAQACFSSCSSLLSSLSTAARRAGNNHGTPQRHKLERDVTNEGPLKPVESAKKPGEMRGLARQLHPKVQLEECLLRLWMLI